jgi:hypothetical protein
MQSKYSIYDILFCKMSSFSHKICHFFCRRPYATLCYAALLYVVTLFRFRSLEKFLFGKVSQVAVDVSSDSDSDDDLEEKESKQRPQWAAISADKSDDSSSSSDNEKEQVEQQGMIKSMSAATKIQEKKLKSKKKKPVWHDEDDDNVLVKDVTATFAKGVGKHGKKETSTENYAKTLRKNFSSLMDTPKWADLDVQRQTEDSDDEFFRVSRFF